MRGPVGFQGCLLAQSLLDLREAKRLLVLGDQGHMVVDLTVGVALLEDHHLLYEHWRLPNLFSTIA